MVDEALRSLQSFGSRVEKAEFESQLTLEDLSAVYPEIQLNDRIVMSKAITGAGLLSATGAGMKTQHSRARNGAILSAMLAITVVKQASAIAFAHKGRSMSSPDVLQTIGEAFDSIASISSKT